MAGLKKSEKRLLIVFGLGLFVAANLIGDKIFATKKDAAEAAAATHEQRITEYEILLQNGPKLERRRAWLDRMFPRFVSEEAAATEIEGHVTRSADAAGATIDSSKPTEPLQRENYTQVAMAVNVSGSSEEVTRFVSLLQSREGFYAIPNATYTTDRRDNTILRCALTVARWYSNETSATPVSPTAGENIAASGQN